MTGVELDQISQSLQQLRTAGQQLGHELQRAADELMEHGVEPPQELIQRVIEHRHGFVAVRDRVAAATQKDLQAVESIPQLQYLWQLESRMEAARQMIAAAERLVHKEDPEFRPLEQIRQECSALRRQLSASNPPRDLLEQITAQQHPLSALISLVSQGSQLPDRLWEQLQDRVLQVYSRDLATAVVRGRLMVGAGSNTNASIF
jgi:hypothetical protein